MSSLGTARYCAQAGFLSEQYGSSLDAAAGTAFHAMDSGEVGWQDKLARLPEELRAQVASWVKLPEVLEVSVPDESLAQNPVLRLSKSKAMREREVKLEFGPTMKDVSLGHFDCAWVVEMNGLKLVVLVDLKRSKWTTPDGTDSLQLHAYGMALTIELDCDAYLPCIWACEEGELLVGELVRSGSDTWVETMEEVESAAYHVEGKATVGGHCMNCYAREHCPEFLLPGALADTTLGPAVTGAIKTNQDALACVLALKALDKLSTAAEKNLKVWAERHGGIYDPSTKQVWGPNEGKGGSSLDKEALEQALASHNMTLAQFTRPGKPRVSFIWKKSRLL